MDCMTRYLSRNLVKCCTRDLPSVLRRCWLGGRKGIRPVKTEWWGAGMVICLEQGADLHTAQLMPLPPTVSCFSKIQIGFTFLVPADLGSPGQMAVKWVCAAHVTNCDEHVVKMHQPRTCCVNNTIHTVCDKIPERIILNFGGTGLPEFPYNTV